MISIWTLTFEVNDYDQHGEYFVDTWLQKPTHKMLFELGVPRNRLRHVLNGGGRKDYEHKWFYLKEKKVESEKQLVLMALEALKYHTEQTRPIERTNQAIIALQKYLKEN